ncbi:hypothetical protein CONLIGDRAFT_637769 [Coniochaeta ligniaria NRRL 30616]|uniref:Uncharacterized protein n=1 Tax=Coniochaeta ligniaria NRRL 30616 TaxID=1408157 RepID=A0A1J7J6E6_9PEZI|nr:hypothetical protein CONLIGDRAFT_637769 [Coniochaeta ligniaria NRRL 30616]
MCNPNSPAHSSKPTSAGFALCPASSAPPASLPSSPTAVTSTKCQTPPLQGWIQQRTPTDGSSRKRDAQS